MSKSSARKFTHWVRPTLDLLECRVNPTTTLFLDFGLGVGMGNTLNETVANLRDIFGAGTGTNMTNGTNAYPAGLAGGDSLDFTPLNYDFDLNGTTNNADLTAMATAVVPLVQRVLEPFDINVVVVGNANFAGAVGSVAANAGDATGQFDAYVYVMTVTSDGFPSGGTSVGNRFDLFGRAAGADLNAQAGNDRDEAALTFSDEVFNSTSGTQGTAAFNQNLAQRLAYTATHEAFHTFTFIHTDGLTASGDVIRVGSNTRESPFIVTRFDLAHDDPATEPNNYLLIGTDADIGLRDANANTIPDLAYATGTGAHDQVILDDTGGGVIDVDVNAFSNAARTTLIASESYNINLATDADGVILVDASINNDEVRVEASIAATLRLRGGQGLDGVATENDLLTLQSTGLNGVYTPGATGTGTVVYAGGATVQFSEFENVEANNVAISVAPLTLSSAVINENGSITVTVDFVNIDTQDTHTVVIDWGDGTPNTVVVLLAGLRTVSRSHQYRDDNPSGTPFDNYTITATVTDQDGDTGSRQGVVRVNNVAPTLSNLAATTINENGTTTLTGRINDPGTLDTFTVSVNWGDLLSPNNVEVYAFPAGTTDFQLTHQYLDDNPSGTTFDFYTINLVVTDDDTGTNPGSTSVLVNNVAPVITAHDNSAPSGDKAEEGETVTVTGAFTDVGTLDTHTVSIDWGDGTVTAGVVVQGSGFGSFSGGHAYASGGIFTVTITLTDDDTQFDTATETVFVTGAGVQPIDGKQVLFVVGTNGNDHVTVNAQGNGTVRVHAGFLPGGQRTFTQTIDEIRMYLCAGDDRGTIAGSVDQPALLDGGAGDDDLNAGGGPAVLLGGTGNDRLIGSKRNDVMIGGTGIDRLVGNAGEDILIGGFTSYDYTGDDDVLAHQKSLLSILAEWNSPRTLTQRRDNIAGVGVGPRLNGSNFLTIGGTVFDDGDSDVFTGSSGNDWFFLFPNDKATDFHGGDLQN